MTKMKKLTSVLLAVVMAMGLAVPAWASMDFSEEDDIVVNLMEDNSYEAEDKLSVIGESGSKIIVVDREIAETMGKEILSYKGASRGQVTATISTPTFYMLGILQKNNTFSKTYSFAIG